MLRLGVEVRVLTLMFWLRSGTYHHLVEGHPAVGGEVLQHGNQELETTIPVTRQQHHTNQVEDTHHRTGKVIGQVEDLQPDEKRGGG